jgi:hypothetical protein
MDGKIVWIAFIVTIVVLAGLTLFFYYRHIPILSTNPPTSQSATPQY